MLRNPLNPFLLLAVPAVTVIVFLSGHQLPAFAASTGMLCVMIMLAGRARRPQSRPAPATVDTLIASAPFKVARETLQPADPAGAGLRDAAELIERGLAYYLPADAQAWAEDALRFLRDGQGPQGIEALDAAIGLSDGANPLAHHNLWNARQLLTQPAVVR